jgi:hypothetical protein
MGGFLIVTTKFCAIQLANNRTTTIQEILIKNDIDIRELEFIGVPKAIKLTKPYCINTPDGIKVLSEIWYDGKTKTKELRFADGSIYELGVNCKLENLRVDKLTVGDSVSNKQISDTSLSTNHIYGFQIPCLLDNGCIVT